MHREPTGRGAGYGLDDGLGIRFVETESDGEITEVLEVAATLASHPAAEQAVRARSARYAGIGIGAVASVRRVERVAGGLRVVADVPAGLRLSDLLADLEFGNESLSDAGVLEIASAVIAAVAAIHELPGGLAHGAVNPSHAVLAADGRVVLTDGVFATTLEALQLNREQLWREYGLALPAAASLPRFDQRADVTALGAIVLALVLRRSLRRDEYPRGVADLVLAATKDASSPYGSALNMWLQQTLQLHPRSGFSAGAAAQRAFAEIVSAVPGVRRAGPQAVQALLRGRGLGAPVEPPLPPAPRPALVPAARPQAAQPRPTQPRPPRGAAAFLRSMFSNPGTS